MNLGFSQQEIKGTLAELNLPEHSYYMRRAARALDLVNQDKVHALSDDVFRVDSQWDDKHYHVELNHGNPGCTCPDHQKNTGAGCDASLRRRLLLCKHMIASMLYAQKQAQEAITIIKTRKPEASVSEANIDGNEEDYWRQSWLIAQGNRRTLVYEERDRQLFCTCGAHSCGAHFGDCIHKKLVIETVTKELKVVNECGSTEAQALQDKMNGQLDSQGNNGNGAKALSHPKLDISNPLNAVVQPLSPLEESESYDIAQIEGRRDGELAWKLSNGEYCISYRGIMTLAEKHSIEFDEVSVNDNTVIAKAKNGRRPVDQAGNERISGKPIYDNANTAMELAKRNCARQLLPLAEILAVEHKAKLNAEFDWQKAYEKCACALTSIDVMQDK